MGVDFTHPLERQLTRRRRLLAVAILLLIVGASALAFRSFNHTTVSFSKTSWQLPRLKGAGVVRLHDYRGKPTVVNFFATWCPTCSFELPAFAKVSRELTGEVQFVGVNSFDDGNGREMADYFGVGWWPLAKDTGGNRGSTVHDLFDSEAMPLTAFYGSDGRVLDTFYGPMSEEILVARLHKLYDLQP